MHRWYRPFAVGLVAALATGGAAHAQPAPTPRQSSVLAASATAPVLPTAAQLQSPGQDQSNAFVRFFRDGEWYFSWGYNKEYWTNSNIHVSQPTLGNDFTMHDVQGTDGFSASEIFSGDLFGPQYNIRIGRFINDDRTIAVELNLDHSKYQTIIGQAAQVTGQINGVPTNANYLLTNQFYSEVLHNGANHLMLNAVYRYPLIGQTNETLSVAAIGKAGAGIMLPHTTDTILGDTNDVGDKSLSNAIGLTNGWWQLNGWTAGVEFGFRVVLYKPVYLELTDKEAYTSLVDLPAYQGTIQQSLWMNEITLSLGVTYDGATLFGPH